MSVKNSIISCIAPLKPQNEVSGPFLFCVYHKDAYPAGNDKMEAPKRGNGADFNPTAPYRMYHGDKIPGFPQHPHRGFETVTVTMDGIIDHSDSLGNAGRYGAGDLQWMTAGKGIVHGENFPLVHKDKPNPTRFFQLWLNLPKKSKMVDPCFVMHWAESIPILKSTDNFTNIRLFAGQLTLSGYSTNAASAVTAAAGDCHTYTALAPPPDSYAADLNNDVGIYFISLAPGGRFVLPAAKGGASSNRMVYYVEGNSLIVSGTSIPSHCAITLNADKEVEFVNNHGSVQTDILVLQGKPINEPVVQYGPFVMNTQEEIIATQKEYSKTKFGGWPWSEDAVLFPREKGRFLLYNGKEEYPPAGVIA